MKRIVAVAALVLIAGMAAAGQVVPGPVKYNGVAAVKEAQVMPGQREIKADGQTAKEPLSCALTMVVGCRPEVVALNLAHAAASLTDTWSTQKNFELCSVIADCAPAKLEENVLTRPFQSHGRPLAYATTIGGIVGLSYLEHRLRNSHDRFLRRAWWLPKVGLTIASAVFSKRNAGIYGRELAKCGQGCADALNHVSQQSVVLSQAQLTSAPVAPATPQQ